LEVDKKVLATGKPSFLHEKIDKSDHGRARVFGVSFVIDE
jgi:hypothetical protein